jgi:hypothetical protein
MLLTRFAALMLAASVLWGAAANAGGPVHPFRYGFWSGGAYTDERTGAFTHCSAGVAYDSGVNLFVLVTSQYRWWLGFINPKWSFLPNAKTSIRLRLDGGTSFERLAIVPNGQLLLVPLPDNSHLIDSFRRSKQLALDTEGQALFFKLAATPGMMDRLTACVRTSLALEDTTSPSGVQSASASPSPANTAEAAPQDPPLPQSLPPVLGDAPSAAPALSAAISSSVAQKPAEHAEAAPSKPGATAATLLAAPQQSANPSAAPPKPAGTAVIPPIAAPKSATTNPGSPPPRIRSADAASSAAENASLPDAASGELRAASAASSTAARSVLAVSPQPAALSPAAADGASQSASRSSTRSIAALPPPVPAAANNPEAAAQTIPAPGPPPLAFTAVNPVIPSPAAVPALGQEQASGTALEEVRLATDFLNRARLPDAHLVVAGKPAALADFAAVWRSEDAAGAVKIIPPGPEVSAVAIASNLIAVDPQVCKGDFTSARLRTHVGNRIVLSAVLTCNEADDERVTQYFIAPRQRGGFVVFAVIRSKGAGQGRDLGRQNLEGLSRAAIQAVGGQG